jgi:CRISPR-associated protein Cas2
MKFIIAYDLESDPVRGRVAEILLTLGERVQKSVFECRITTEECDHLIERLRREIGGTAGNVRVYRLCENCWEASLGIGTIKTTIDGQPCVIV